MDCAQLFLKRVHLAVFEANLLLEVDAVRQEQVQHLREIIVQFALILDRFLDRDHGLPDVAEMVLIAFESRCVLISSPLEILQQCQVFVTLLSFAHRDLAAECFRRSDQPQELLKPRLGVVAVLLYYVLQFCQELVYLLFDQFQICVGRAPSVYLGVKLADLLLFF